MAALITALIDKVDNVKVVQDKIAEILTVEIDNQKTLAADAQRDPRLWDIRVFVERMSAWEEFANKPDESLDQPPIVNIWYERATYDRSKSDPVERQQADGVYNIDVYGAGMSQGDGGEGHIAGEVDAADTRDRALMLVRNILMAAQYTYLDMRGTVAGRWPESISTFQVPAENSSLQHIAAARLALQVSFNEFSPQVVGETMDAVNVIVKRTSTGETYLTAQYKAT